MTKILVEDIKLTVRVGKTMGEHINTNIGVPQGDSLSLILFIIYLAAALQALKHIQEKHNIPDKYHIIPLMIDLQYTDDISWITNNSEKVTEIEEAESKLEDKYLQVNNTKTGKHDIERNGQTNWMKCKFPMSLRDTEHDIKQIKGLALGAYNDLKHIFESKRASIVIKIRIMNSHISTHSEYISVQQRTMDYDKSSRTCS